MLKKGWIKGCHSCVWSLITQRCGVSVLHHDAKPYLISKQMDEQKDSCVLATLHSTTTCFTSCSSIALNIAAELSQIDHLLCNVFKSLDNDLSLSVAAIGQDLHQSPRI